MKHEDWVKYKEEMEKALPEAQRRRANYEKEQVKEKWRNIFRVYRGLPDSDRYFDFRTDRPAPVDPLNYEGMGR